MLPLVGLQSVVVGVPLAKPLEQVVNVALTTTLQVVEWVVPQAVSPSRVLGWQRKGQKVKVD